MGTLTVSWLDARDGDFGGEPENSIARPLSRGASLLFPTTCPRTSDGALLTCWPTSRKAQLETGEPRNSTARPLSREHPYFFPTTSPRTSDGELLVCWPTSSKTELESRIPNTDAALGHAPRRRREVGASVARHAVWVEPEGRAQKKSMQCGLNPKVGHTEIHAVVG